PHAYLSLNLKPKTAITLPHQAAPDNQQLPAAGEALSRQSNIHTQEGIDISPKKMTLPREYDRFLNISCITLRTSFMKITKAAAKLARRCCFGGIDSSDFACRAESGRRAVPVCRPS
ncbi:MAG: hypothetical protein JJU08_19025, partial [Rhodobacteraceae bacterium]|nr:hypothetical protein [Paracoccaceae bacterium]